MTQAEALSILKTGVNVFLTGEPGSGKTHLIKKYVEYLRDNGIEPAITASTGIAATHIGGVTIHSWSGIGIKDKLTKRDFHDIETNKRVMKHLKATEVLIIDEVSMLSANTFELVESVCRKFRDPKRPFGGMQIVLVGDFFQLPPVIRKKEIVESHNQDLGFDEEPPTFAFDSPVWEKLELTVCYLREQHRQDDTVFLDALNSIRRGEPNDSVRECFTARIVTQLPKDTITKLFPHNANVDRLNDVELGKLPGKVYTYKMLSRGVAPLVDGLKRSCLSPETLLLKLKAKVMFTKNSPQGLYVNGTLGEVTGFGKDNNPVVRTRAGRTVEVEPVDWAIQDGPTELAAISQYPLRLAWAITVHKSQGMSLDAAVMDLRSAFEYGQGYVALSRVRELSGLYLLGFNERALEVHPVVSEKDGRFREMSDIFARRFASLDRGALANRQRDFIRACGGKIGAGTKKAPPPVSTFELTRALLMEGNQTLESIARKRGMTIGTIIGHLEKLVDEKKIVARRDLAALRPEPARLEVMKEALVTVHQKEGAMFLSQTREILGADYSFDEIRLARLFV